MKGAGRDYRLLERVLCGHSCYSRRQRGWGEYWAKHCLSLVAAGPSWSTTRSIWHSPALQRISTWSSTHLPQLPSTQLWVSQGHHGLSKDWIGDIWNFTLWESLGWELFSFIPRSWLLGAAGERSLSSHIFLPMHLFLSCPLSRSSDCLSSVSRPFLCL